MGSVARRFDSPPFSRRGGCASIKSPRSLTAQTGWLVKGRVAPLYARAALLILFEITNHPVCAAFERGLFIEAQPPLLENGGESNRLATLLLNFHPEA